MLCYECYLSKCFIKTSKKLLAFLRCDEQWLFQMRKEHTLFDFVFKVMWNSLSKWCSNSEKLQWKCCCLRRGLIEEMETSLAPFNFTLLKTTTAFLCKPPPPPPVNNCMTVSCQNVVIKSSTKLMAFLRCAEKWLFKRRKGLDKKFLAS